MVNHYPGRLSTRAHLGAISALYAAGGRYDPVADSTPQQRAKEKAAGTYIIGRR